MIYLVCGYRGSGKDTLFKQLSDNSSIPFNWIILRNPSIPFTFNQLITQSINQLITQSSGALSGGVINRIKRVSFADNLKKSVLEWIQFPSHLDPEIFKDMSLKEIEDKNGIKLRDGCDRSLSLRDYYRSFGQIKRLEDPDYWCKLSFSHLPVSALSAQSFIVTDWRYHNEYEYLNKLVGNGGITNKLPNKLTNTLTNELITMRVFRKSVAIPPMIPSEHSLDDFATDYVFIPEQNHLEELQYLCKQFPFYQDYILTS